MIEGFGPVETTGGPGAGSLATWLPGGLSLGQLDGFLIVANDGSELKAITPDASKLWVREFAVPQRPDLDFWSKALRSDLIDHRGYRLIEETPVRDGKWKDGLVMVFDVVAQGQAQRYLVCLYALDAPSGVAAARFAPSSSLRPSRPSINV